MLSPVDGYADALAEAVELAREARDAIARGSVGYRLFVAQRSAAPRKAL